MLQPSVSSQESFLRRCYAVLSSSLQCTSFKTIRVTAPAPGAWQRGWARYLTHRDISDNSTQQSPLFIRVFWCFAIRGRCWAAALVRPVGDGLSRRRLARPRRPRARTCVCVCVCVCVWIAAAGTAGRPPAPPPGPSTPVAGPSPQLLFHLGYLFTPSKQAAGTGAAGTGRARQPPSRPRRHPQLLMCGPKKRSKRFDFCKRLGVGGIRASCVGPVAASSPPALSPRTLFHPEQTSCRHRRSLPGPYLSGRPVARARARARGCGLRRWAASSARRAGGTEPERPNSVRFHGSPGARADAVRGADEPPLRRRCVRARAQMCRARARADVVRAADEPHVRRARARADVVNQKRNIAARAGRCVSRRI